MRRLNGTTAWVIGLALFIVGTVGPATAQSDEAQWDHCLRQDKFPEQQPQDIIANCRRVLNIVAFQGYERTYAFNNIGVANVRLQNYDVAIRAYSDALREIADRLSVPEYRQLAVFTRRNRAFAYARAKQFDKALADYDFQALEEKDAKSRGLKCKAHALYDTNFTSGLADCKAALDADKGAGDAYAGWLIVEYRQGAFADVVSDCKLTGAMLWLTPDATYVCGLAERKAGDPKRAEMFLTAAAQGGEQTSERFKELGIE